MLSLATVSISFLAIFCFARRLVFPPHQHFCHGEPSLFSASYNTLRRKSCLKEKTRSPCSLRPRVVTHLSGTVSYIPPKKLKLQVEAFSAPPSRSSSHRWIQALSVCVFYNSNSFAIHMTRVQCTLPFCIEAARPINCFVSN